MDNTAAIFAKLDAYTLAWHSLKAWKRIQDDLSVPTDVYDKVEDLIEILEYIEGWQPSDADMIANNSCGTPWHDGCR